MSEQCYSLEWFSAFTPKDMQLNILSFCKSIGLIRRLYLPEFVDWLFAARCVRD